MNFAENLTANDMHEAAQQLAKSEKGRDALHHLTQWMDESGLSLDQTNQIAVFILLCGLFGSFPGTARDEMIFAVQISEASSTKGGAA